MYGCDCYAYGLLAAGFCDLVRRAGLRCAGPTWGALLASPVVALPLGLSPAAGGGAWLA